MKKTLLGLMIPATIATGAYFGIKSSLKEKERISNIPYQTIVQTYEKNINNGLKSVEEKFKVYTRDRYLSDNEAEELDEDVERLYKITNKAPLLEKDKKKLTYLIKNSEVGEFEEKFSDVNFRDFLEERGIMYKGATDGEELMHLVALLACIIGAARAVMRAKDVKEIEKRYQENISKGSRS